MISINFTSVWNIHVLIPIPLMYTCIYTTSHSPIFPRQTKHKYPGKTISIQLIHVGDDVHLSILRSNQFHSCAMVIHTYVHVHVNDNMM